MTRTARLALILTSVGAAAAVAKPAEPVLTVATSGTEPALKFGKTMIARPFGAQLVDQLAIDGRYSVGRERLYLVRGTAGADCPSHYMIVATKPGTAPALSPPFGTCGTGVAAQVTQGRLVMTIAGAQPGTPPVRYIYDNGAAKPADAGYADAGPLVSCRAYKAMPDPVDVALLLDRSLPDDYRRMSLIRRAEIAPDTLRDMVTDLACLATLPNGDKIVPKSAAPLFASRRYGEAAYAALDDVARTPATGPDLRAAVRAFSAQMHYYVGRRTSI